jgi:N4-gp56 family major capsid protein
MAIQKLNTQAARIGKFKAEIISHAIPVEVLGITGMNKPMPKNSGEQAVFRRWLPVGGVDNRIITGANVGNFASDYETVEGVTPTAKTLGAVDVTATLTQYAVLFSFTDKTVDLYEDNVPDEMKVQVGETMGAVREMVRYGALKGATNAYYAGGSSRSTVDESLSINLIRRVTRGLMQNHGKMITKVMSSSPSYGTQSVEASFLVFCSTDMEAAIRDLPGFTNVADYGSRQTINENELGSVERFRFILSPELAPYINAGAAVGSTGLFSTGGSNIDVYPVIVVAEEAWGQVALRGANSLDVTFLAAGTKDKNDPLGQRGYVGASAYMTALILNQGRMAVIECGTPSLN